MAVKIIYEDKDILVCEKPAGLAVQSARISEPDMVSELKNYLTGKQSAGAPGKSAEISAFGGTRQPASATASVGVRKPQSVYLGVVHRLDQPVSGLLVFAKNKKAAGALSTQTAQHQMNKIYYAVVYTKEDLTGKRGTLTDWLVKEASIARVCDASQNGAKNIYSTGDALQKFGEAGLQDYNPVGKTMYACAGYFKMGATDKQTGIILPALKIGRKKASNVELTFETCPNIGGSGKADAVTVTVEIVEGPGTVNGNSDRESEAMKPDQTWKWTPMSVKLYGVTAATRIAIRSTQQGNPGVTAGEKGYFRWYLDNVKIVKAPRN